VGLLEIAVDNLASARTAVNRAMGAERNGLAH